MCMATLGKLSGAMSTEFGAASKVLKELVLNHVREEENNIWPDVREHFSGGTRRNGPQAPVGEAARANCLTINR